MGNGVSGDHGNFPSYGKRDVGATFDRKQHDWSEQARAQEVDTLSVRPNSYIDAQPWGSKFSISSTEEDGDVVSAAYLTLTLTAALQTGKRNRR